MALVFNRIRTKFENFRISLQDRKLQSVDLRSTVMSIIPANCGNKQQKKLCLFAHYDQTGKIADYVINYCAELQRCGYDIALISTSPSLNDADTKRALNHVRCVIHRKNMGYDFVSWRVGLMTISDFESYEELLIANDSVFGPFHNLAEVFDKIAASPAPMTGLTDNWEKCYHVQSYFIHFKKPALHSEVFRVFWNQVRMRADKESIIISYEVGLSQHFIRNGFKVHALYPFHEVREKCLSLGESFQYRERILRQPVNSTIFMWDVLLTEFGFPFIKTELLKTNRFQSVAIPSWRKLIPEKYKQVAHQSEDYLKLGHENCRV